MPKDQLLCTFFDEKVAQKTHKKGIKLEALGGACLVKLQEASSKTIGFEGEWVQQKWLKITTFHIHFWW